MKNTAKNTPKQSILKKSEIVKKAPVEKYANDPFFLKKAADAKAFLLKNGLPKELVDQGIKIDE